MIKVAIYGKKINDDFLAHLKLLFDIMSAGQAKLIIFKPFYETLPKDLICLIKNIDLFTVSNDLDKDIDILLSIGGDGTFLDSVTLVQDKGIPIAGINSGRLGFLANISRNEIEPAIQKILTKAYSYEERELIQLSSPKGLFDNCNFALNEITVGKMDSNAMLTIHVYLNGQFLNTYWADGLIIATPTGSTAYSLSVGGPIVVPDAKNFIITPLAPHNLTVRPIVVSNDKELTLRIEGRNENYLISLDRRYQSIQPGVEIKINKANFKIKVVKHDDRTFFSTLREKFMWGLDKRN
jgi:NAD+ kinase